MGSDRAFVAGNVKVLEVPVRGGYVADLEGPQQGQRLQVQYTVVTDAPVFTQVQACQVGEQAQCFQPLVCEVKLCKGEALKFSKQLEAE
eukprot:scaffold74022_cov43-Prasinocladus_malaysianus.AAC.1